MYEAIFEAAVRSKGQAYLDAEGQIIALGQNVIPFLQQQMESNSPLARLVAKEIMGHINEDKSFKECLDFLNEVEQETGLTIKGGPPLQWVFDHIKEQFSDNVVPLLGVYIIKLSDIWRPWKVISVIAYLSSLSSTVSGDALIQFVIATSDEYYRGLATQAIYVAGDQNMLDKIDAQIALPDLPKEARDALKQVADKIRNEL